jgi:hypothetical protein
MPRGRNMARKEFRTTRAFPRTSSKAVSLQTTFLIGENVSNLFLLLY